MLNPALSSSYGFEKLEIPRPNVLNQEHNDRKKRFESERVLNLFLIFLFFEAYVRGRLSHRQNFQLKR